MNLFFLRLNISFFLLFICIVSSAASELDSLGTKRVGDVLCVMHEVEQGETLYSLSRRYSSKVKEIKIQNDLKKRAIEIGEVLLIPIKSNDNALIVESEKKEGIHVVQKGETVYSISKKYGLLVQQVIDWNNLEGTNISVGQSLTISQETQLEVPPMEEVEVPVDVEETPYTGPVYSHFVQPGETVYSISRMFKIDADTLRAWNGLAADDLSIGQELVIRRRVVIDSLQHLSPNYQDTPYGSRIWMENNDGVELVKEEGLVGVIEGTESSTKRLALHRELAIGTELTILNLMNNKRIRAKVVGRLPNTGINRNLMLRLTAASFSDLGIIDQRSRVEISYPNEEE